MALKPQDILVALKLAAYGIRTNTNSNSKLRATSLPHNTRLGWTEDELQQNEFQFEAKIHADYMEAEKESITFSEDDIDYRLIKNEPKSDIWTYRQIADELYISSSESSAAIKRCLNAKLLKTSTREGKPEPIRGNIEEFIIHAAKFIFPATRGSETRGIPTAYASPLFEKLIAQPDSLPPVWPDPYGIKRGISLAPIYKTASKAAKRDVELYELLVIVDIFRLGRPREIEIATKLLSERLSEL